MSAKIEIDLLKAIISNMNKGSIKVDGIQAFVTDSLGLSTIANVKQVKKQLHFELKKDRDELKAKILEQQKKQKAEKKLYKKKKRVESKIRWKEKSGKMLLKLKKLFVRRKK